MGLYLSYWEDDDAIHRNRNTKEARFFYFLGRGSGQPRGLTGKEREVYKSQTRTFKS
jgi:hypothetical protein